MPEPTRSPESPEQPAQVRTFLIADVRGYSRFTQERGDEAAARLAAAFAELARTAIVEGRGRLLELRGDEALAVFESTRQALRTAVDLQTRFARHSEQNPEVPLPVGIGIDAGEAIAVEGGYRGGALNLAARLCSLAGPGEILATEMVTHLARKVEGLAYIERGPMRLKGFADPVRAVQIVTEQEMRNRDPAQLARSKDASRTPPAFPLGPFLQGVLEEPAEPPRAPERPPAAKPPAGSEGWDTFNEQLSSYINERVAGTMSEVQRRQTETLEKTKARQIERGTSPLAPASRSRAVPWPAIATAVILLVIVAAVIVFLVVR